MDVIKKMQEKTRRYWTEDGLPDIYLGLVLIFYALLLIWQSRSPSPWAGLLPALFLLAAVLPAGLVLQWLKERLTYPRAGYVRYAAPRRNGLRRRLPVLGFLAALILLIIYIPLDEHSAILAFSLFFALIMGIAAWQQRSRRLTFYAIYGLAAAVITLWMYPAHSLSQCLLALGIVILLGGLITLGAFLRTYPPTSKEAA